MASLVGPTVARARANPLRAGRGRVAYGFTAVFGSLVDRLRRLEGALLAVNVSWLAVGEPHPGEATALVLASLLVLTALYGFNDSWDAAGDTNNPRKNRWLAEAHLAYRKQVALVLLWLSSGSLLFAWVGGGLPSAFAVAAVLAVNALYSFSLKGVPLLDVVWCGLWGATYAAIVRPPWPLLAVVGLMTAVCHVYQTASDREVDARNGVRTSAAAAPQAVPLVLAACCTLLALMSKSFFGAHWAVAASAFLPLLPHFVCSNPQTGWLLTKAYFAVLWVALLREFDAIG